MGHLQPDGSWWINNAGFLVGSQASSASTSRQQSWKPSTTVNTEPSNQPSSQTNNPPDTYRRFSQMLDAGTPKSVVAKTIGVSRPTLYTHLGRLINDGVTT